MLLGLTNPLPWFYPWHQPLCPSCFPYQGVQQQQGVATKSFCFPQGFLGPRGSVMEGTRSTSINTYQLFLERMTWLFTSSV